MMDRAVIEWNYDDREYRLTKIKGYDEAMTKKLIKIRERSWAYTWIHRENALYLRRWFDRVTYINIAMNLLTATSLFVTASVCSETYYVRLLTGIISMVNGFVAMFLKYKDYGMAIGEHKRTQSAFSKIYDTIDGQLSTPIGAKQEAHHFHSWVSKEFDLLLGTAPEPDESVIHNYIKKFGKRRKIHPYEAAEFERDSNQSTTQNNNVDNFTSSTSSTPAATKPSGSKEDSVMKSVKIDIHGSAASSDSNSDFCDYEDEPPQSSVRNTHDPPGNNNIKEQIKSSKGGFQPQIQPGRERFNSAAYDYQMTRMNLNTNRCFIDPFDDTFDFYDTSKNKK